MIRFTLQIVLLLALLSLGACNKTEQAFTDIPIIESYLSPAGVAELRIRRQIPFIENPDYADVNIDALSITMRRNNESFVLHAYGDGYYADSSITISVGDEFYFSFDYNGEQVSGYTFIPDYPTNLVASDDEMSIERMDTSSGPPSGGITLPDPISLTWDNPDQSYYLVVVENLEEELDPIRDFGDDAPPGNLFRKSPTNSSSERLSPMDFQYYGTHRVLLYHVLADYAALYDQNSSSSLNLTNPSTSIEYAYGIFSGMAADTLYIEITE